MIRTTAAVGAIALLAACAGCGGSGGPAGGGGATTPPAPGTTAGPSPADAALVARLNADIRRLDGFGATAVSCSGGECLTAIARRIKRFSGSQATALRAPIAHAGLDCLKVAGKDLVVALEDYGRAADAAIAKDFAAGHDRLVTAQADLDTARAALADCPAGAG